MIARALLLASLAIAGPAAAQEPAPLFFSVTPTDPARPYRMQATWVARRDAEVVFDRRLISFELRAGPRGPRVRCRHPDAPGRASAARSRMARASETHGEWIDLRMYCWGERAARALAAGGELRVAYGFGRRPTAARWIVRVPGEPRPAVGRVEAPAVTLPARPPPQRPEGARVELRPADASHARALTFVATLSSDRPARAYVRPDLFRFRVSGPTGDRECGIPRLPTPRRPEMFGTLGGRRRIRVAIDAHRLCRGAFDAAGVYEVVPVLDLQPDERSLGLEALTGEITGDAAPVRIRVGDLGYVEHLDASPPAGMVL